MRRLAQSTAYTVMLKLFLSSDHVTAATGKTVAITISKAGGAFGNPNAGASNGTEVSNGWYKFALDTTDTGSLGDLVVRGTSASCDDAEQVCQVVSATTGGATNLDAAISAVKTKTDSLTFTVTNQVDSNVVDWKGATAPAMTGDAYARLGAPAGASVSADVAAVKSDTGNIGTAGAGLTALGDTRIAHLDADVSTRSTPTNITAGTITTVTNLTNAPTAGDLTATMKASVTTAATAATPTVSSVSGSVGSVTGNVGGNVVGSVGSVAGAVASVTGNVGGNVTGSVGSVAAAVTVTGTVNADIKKVNGVTVNGNGAGTPWGP